MEKIIKELSDKLSAEIEALRSDLTEANAKIDAQKETIDSLERTQNLMAEKISVLEQAAEESESRVQNLSEKTSSLNVESKKKPKEIQKDVPVKIDKTEYTFAYPKFSFEGKDYLASDAAQDKKLCAEILENAPQLLREAN